MNEVKCALTGRTNVFLEKQILAEKLIGKYHEKFGIDVSYLFQGIKYVDIYKCADTGYRFYYPFSLAGDDNFYRHFGKYDWYYLPWKWEHENCLQYICDGDMVLEVGAGNGNFLKGLRKFKNVEAVGLELSSDATGYAMREKVNLLNQSIEDHAVNKANKYDVVCSFQVLEHLPYVHQAIEAMVRCLKPGGKLIISVPNNNSFIKDNPNASEILNMPPHHMGLWNEASLKSLCLIFPIEHIATHLESLQPAQMDTYQYTKVRQFLFNSELLVRIYWKLRIHLIIRPLLKLFSSRITGHTILCVYTKK